VLLLRACAFKAGSRAGTASSKGARLTWGRLEIGRALLGERFPLKFVDVKRKTGFPRHALGGKKKNSEKIMLLSRTTINTKWCWPPESKVRGRDEEKNKIWILRLGEEGVQWERRT